MSQADMERAYTEAVDQLARAVEANRLLTERLQAYEIRDAAVRRAMNETADDKHKYSADERGVAISVLDMLDQPVGSSHPEEPPARPGEP